MAQIKQLLEQLAMQLFQRGVPCYVEYPDVSLAAHDGPLVAIAASEKLQLHAPIYTADAVILPAAMTVSVRFLQKMHSEDAQLRLQNRVMSDLLPAAFALGWQITAVQTDEIRYDKQIDRLCLAAHMTVQTLITMPKSQEEVAADAV